MVCMTLSIASRVTRAACIATCSWTALACASKQPDVTGTMEGGGSTADMTTAPNMPAEQNSEDPSPDGAETPSAGDGATEGPVLAPVVPTMEEEPPEGVIDFGVSDEPTTEVEVVCAAQAAASELTRVYLAFAVDVSASMWQGPNRFPNKWEPVIRASEAFFAEPDSAAISASLTFFPVGADDAARCDAATYSLPHVPQRLLPSTDFSGAITALGITAQTPGQNYFASPTLAAFNGTVESLRVIGETDPDAFRAVVLVTDGIPQTCADVNVQTVADAVRASGIRTYVIGVGNPPQLGAGDNLDELNLIAEAGGTEAAFIVQTNDPAQAQADFKAVIDGIRGVSVSCNIEIPLPPAGTEFVPEKVNVTYGSASGEDVKLNYDAECASTNSWRYDDPTAPATIVLCNDTCDAAQRDVTAKVDVEFGCERRGVIR